MIDDVDQVYGLGDAPEDLAYPGENLPVVCGMYPGQFSNIAMGTVVITLVNPVEGCEGEDVTTCIPFLYILRLRCDREVAVALLREGRVLEKDRAFKLDIAAPVARLAIDQRPQADGGNEEFLQGACFLAGAFQRVLVKVTLVQSGVVLVVGLNQPGAFPGLVIFHVHLVGTPETVQVLVVISQQQGL